MLYVQITLSSLSRLAQYCFCAGLEVGQAFTVLNAVVDDLAKYRQAVGVGRLHIGFPLLIWLPILRSCMGNVFLPRPNYSARARGEAVNSLPVGLPV